MDKRQQTPLVSAVIPTRNRPDLVCRAVRSAMGQTYSNLEIIVVVDGPDPDTVKELGSLQEARLRVVVLRENVGVSEARNAGVLESRGEWIAFLDDDDEWFPEKTTKQIALALKVDQKTNFISCRIEERGHDSIRVQPHDFPSPGEHWSDYIYCRGGVLLPSTFVVKRTTMLAMPFTKGLRRHEDFDWLLRAQAVAVIHPQWIDDILAVYHNEIGTNRLSTRSEWRGLYEWFVGNRSLLTSKSVPYYLGRMCIPEARLSPSPVRDCCFLLKEAASYGRLSIRSLLYLLVVTLSSRKWRSSVRIKWAPLFSSLSSPFSPWSK